MSKPIDLDEARKEFVNFITKTNEIKTILINTPSTHYFLSLKNFHNYKFYFLDSVNQTLIRVLIKILLQNKILFTRS